MGSYIKERLQRNPVSMTNMNRLSICTSGMTPRGKAGGDGRGRRGGGGGGGEISVCGLLRRSPYHFVVKVVPTDAQTLRLRTLAQTLSGTYH